MSVSRVEPWLLALACSWIAFCNTGIYRASSVLYVELIRVLGVSRETASWPFSLFGAVSSFTGILPGLLSNHFTVHQFVFLGAFLSTLGVFLCYFTLNATMVTFSFGIMSGIGSGLIMTLLPVTLNRQFEKNRATANGIFLSGATISLLVLPYLTEWLVDVFALRGTFLLLSGLVMNVFVGAALARVCDDHGKTTKMESRTFKTNTDVTTVQRLDNSVPVGVGSSVDNDRSNAKIVYQSELADEEESSIAESLLKPVVQTTPQFDSKLQANVQIEGHQSNSGVHASRQSMDLNISEQIGAPKRSRYNKVREALASVAVPCWNLLCDPLFLVITFCSVTTRTVVVTFSLILVDYLMDKGQTEMQGVLLVSLVAIPELVGRLGSGWISDRGFLSRGRVFGVAESVSGMCLFALTLAISSWQRYALSALFALTNGAAFILVNVLYVEYLGMERLPFALGLKNLFTGLASLTRPWLIGVFRDNNFVQSYDYLFHALGAISVLAGTFWFFEPLIKHKSTRTT